MANRGRAHTTGHQHNRPDPEMVMHYMSSSVKDLVKKLEGEYATPKLPLQLFIAELNSYSICQLAE